MVNFCVFDNYGHKTKCRWPDNIFLIFLCVYAQPTKYNASLPATFFIVFLDSGCTVRCINTKSNISPIKAKFLDGGVCE